MDTLQPQIEIKIKLSIVILNYNTKNITIEAIKSIETNYPDEVQSGEYEIIVADNDSPDDSIQLFNEYEKHTKIKSFIICDNKKNLGFSKGNNLAIKLAHGKYILILNPDTLVPPGTLNFILDFIQSHADAAAVTCKIISPTGELDKNCLRGFPTPWNAFCHFSGLSSLFPASRFFSGYLQSGWRDISKTQQVDAIEGAFMLIPKIIGDKIGWFDEDYFFYGEDLQLCYDIHKAGCQIYYIPDVYITHYGGVSSGIKKQSEKITTAGIETKRQVQGYRFDAMRIFFQKNYSRKYPKFLTKLIIIAINLLHKKNS